MNNIPSHAICAMLAVIGLLIIANLTKMILQRLNPEKDYNELRLRINSWWLMVGLLFVILSIGNQVAIIFFGFISFIALKECLSIVPLRQADRRVIFLAYLSIPFQYYWISIHWYGMYLIFIPVYMFLLLPMRMVLIGETHGFIRSLGIIHWAVMLTVFCLSHLAYILALPVLNPQAGNVGLVLFLLFLTQFNDVGQYIFGKLFGRVKIIPKVSPNKTVEGFLGGLILVTIFSGYCAPLLTPLSLKHSLILGIIIAFSGFIGDTVISAVKRDLQIKDSGKLIPGHGGILDRLDSLTYTAPIFFHYIYYFYY
ncbi:MAG: phosphatidate cytidylyltransferase [Proteobacteria bacterium]|nr:phosphatidate cytidylyltransferase [Pseudomonadota bacterium]